MPSCCKIIRQIIASLAKPTRAFTVILDEVHDDCERMNTRCVIVLIPSKLTVYWPIAFKILSGEGYQCIHAAIEEEAKV